MINILLVILMAIVLAVLLLRGYRRVVLEGGKQARKESSKPERVGLVKSEPTVPMTPVQRRVSPQDLPLSTTLGSSTVGCKLSQFLRCPKPVNFVFARLPPSQSLLLFSLLPHPTAIALPPYQFT